MATVVQLKKAEKRQQPQPRQGRQGHATYELPRGTAQQQGQNFSQFEQFKSSSTT